MDCSLPGSSVLGIFQARLLEWVAIPFPEDLPDPGIEPRSPALAGGFFTTEPTRTSLGAQTVKLLSTVRESRVQILGWEDPLEKEMAIHSRILPGKSHGQRSLVGYSPWGRKELDMTE